MRLRNRDGETLDAVPFLVVAGLTTLLCVSFGPLYAAAFGLSSAVAVAGPITLALVVTGVAYHQMVWTMNPLRRTEIPPGRRLKRILLGGAVLGFVLLVLSLPLL